MEPNTIAFEGIEIIQSLVAEVAEGGALSVHLGLCHIHVVVITHNNTWGAYIESRNVLFVHVETT